MSKCLIVACDKNLGIGKNNDLPWKLREEMNFFKETTLSLKVYKKKNVVIMGRNTWESIPTKYKPLRDRINIIITSKDLSEEIKDLPETFVFPSYYDAIEHINKKYKINYINKIFVIGGERLYKEALIKDNLVGIYITDIYDDFDCDRYLCSKEELKEKLKDYKLISCSPFKSEYCPINKKVVYYRHKYYKNTIYIDENLDTVFKNEEEYQYLNLLKKITTYGINRGDRTGTGTISTFGEYQKYSLRDTFPILTTKRIFVKGIFEELMLYIRGKTDNKILNDKGIHIWDGNTSREFLDRRGLNHYQEGDMGETYGFNFRHFGGNYQGCQIKYEKGEEGFDQLQNVIDLIKNNPESRRIIISLWNPKTNHKAALPSCLCWYQFYVNTKDKELSLLINIRSSDFFLANNWNVCTGALLCHMICNLEDIDLTPGDITVMSGDTHIYLNHLDQVKINLSREPRPYPKLIFKEPKKNIEHYQYDDLTLLDYKPYPNIKAEMSV